MSSRKANRGRGATYTPYMARVRFGQWKEEGTRAVHNNVETNGLERNK